MTGVLRVVAKNGILRKTELGKASLMKLQSKVFILLTTVWAAISVGIYIDSNFMLEKNYVITEEKIVGLNLNRVIKALDGLVDSLRILNMDWSQWDQTYNFMQTHNTLFLKDNFTFTNYTHSTLNFMLFFDQQGEYYYGRVYDVQKKKLLDVPASLLAQLKKVIPLQNLLHNNTNTAGYVRIPENNLIISAYPIMPDTGDKKSRGLLVMGYIFNGSHLATLMQKLSLKIHFNPLPLSSSENSLVTAYKQLLAKHTIYYVAPLSDQTIAGYTLIYDINRHPIALLSIEMPRILYHEGMVTISHYILIVIFLGILMLVLMWYFLKIFVLNRVLSVSKQVVNINLKSKFSSRIKVRGKDEISKMVGAINSLMEIIELTQDQLKQRILQRTEKLERLSGLNKNLFNEVHRQREIEMQLRKDEKFLRKMAYYDDLTGLPNRLQFNEQLQEALTKAKAAGSYVAVLFLDADKFKSINDTYGHDIGDKFLFHIATQLKSMTQTGCTVGRFSGDEFVLFMEHVEDKTLINRLIEQIFIAMDVPFKVGDLQIKSTFSIGVSIYPQDGRDIKELEKNADLAMYYAKKSVGNAHYYFEDIRVE